jgi:hypothetical protein
MLKKFTHSGNLIIAGFFLMLMFMSFLVYKSILQRTDMVSANYYEQELNFQDNIDARQNSEAYQFGVDVKDGGVELKIPAQLAAAMKDATISFYCAADSRQDKMLKLAAGSGVFSISTKGWKHMCYIAKISFVSSGKTYYKEVPVIL